MQLSTILNDLLRFYEGEVERVGFVLKSGEIVEVQNICDEPTQGFDVSGEDIIKYEADAFATWHTHPDQDANLSANDYETFLNWPDLNHFIVGNDGVRQYQIVDGELLNC